MRVNKTLAAIAAAAFLLQGCANSPSSIAPTSVSSDEYSHLSCEELNSELALATSRLEEASEKQNGAQVMDAITVFLVLVPASAIAGDSEADVAQYKGEKLAVERAIKKRCVS